MYKSLTKEDIRRLLKVPEGYKVDGLLVSGTNSKVREYPYLLRAVKKSGASYKKEQLEEGFFSDIKILVIGDKRIWFDVVYGTAYLSELIHVASLLGSKANILLGSCGAFLDGLNVGDTVIPRASYGNESSTRMYQRDNKTYVYESDAHLRSEIKRHLSTRKTINEGVLVTVQAMMAETKEDVDKWVNKGYAGVDMESATVFAVSNHFGVPSAALLYVADNLVKNELVSNPSYDYELLRIQRMAIREENYEAAIKVLTS
jgi:purine-nucleoside phosphorylase